MHVKRDTRAQGPRGGTGRGCQRTHVCFTPLQAAVTGPQFKAMLSELPLVPRQKWVVKERGTGEPFSWTICSSRKGAVGPKALESPQLVAVILDDDLYSVVPQLSP